MSSQTRQPIVTAGTAWTIGAGSGALVLATVAVTRLHMSPAVVIALALVVMSANVVIVASAFMHLQSGGPWVLGTLLLTAVLFAGLLLVPLMTVHDTIGTSSHYPIAKRPAGTGGR